jgi:hypothetical protein
MTPFARTFMAEKAARAIMKFYPWKIKKIKKGEDVSPPLEKSRTSNLEFRTSKTTPPDKPFLPVHCAGDFLPYLP